MHLIISIDDSRLQYFFRGPSQRRNFSVRLIFPSNKQGNMEEAQRKKHKKEKNFQRQMSFCMLVGFSSFSSKRDI
jgi:hypothetical protein